MRLDERFKGHRLADSAYSPMAEGEGQVDYTGTKAYVTKDGSLVRELMHPNVHGKSNVSVAETIVPAGKTTLLHK